MVGYVFSVKSNLLKNMHSVMELFFPFHVREPSKQLWGKTLYWFKGFIFSKMYEQQETFPKRKHPKVIRAIIWGAHSDCRVLVVPQAKMDLKTGCCAQMDLYTKCKP